MTKRRSWRLLTLVTLTLLAGCGSSSSSSSSSSPSSSSSSPASGGGTPTAAAGTSPGACQDPASAIAATRAGAGQIGFEGVRIQSGELLAPQCTTQAGTVDGISCGPTEQLAYHIHAHLAVYVNGGARALPAGIGIPGSITVLTSEGPVAAGGQCIYWLHTHAPDGVIHVESPTQRVYTLGNFFDEWHQPLSARQVGGASGPVTAIVDGKPWKASPRMIRLVPHAVIQLDVGAPVVAFQPMSWAGLQL